MVEKSRQTYSIGVVGIGNLGWHIAQISMRYFPTRELCLVHKRAITPDLTAKKQLIIRRFFKIGELPKNLDIVFVCVQDDKLEEVLQKASEHLSEKTLIVHCSGSTNINAIPRENRAVVYPLQSFKKGEFVKYDMIPFFLEAEKPEHLELLENLFLRVSRKVYQQDSEKRLRIHIGAVFAHNFTNFMWTIAQHILEKHQIPFRVLYPLIENATQKISKTYLPNQLQTGPAVRGDKKTIELHIQTLQEEFPEAIPIYKEVSDLIYSYFNNLSQVNENKPEETD